MAGIIHNLLLTPSPQTLRRRHTNLFPLCNPLFTPSSSVSFNPLRSFSIPSTITACQRSDKVPILIFAIYSLDLNYLVHLQTVPIFNSIVTFSSRLKRSFSFILIINHSLLGSLCDYWS